MFRTIVFGFLLSILLIQPAVRAQGTIITANWGPPSAANEWQKFEISLTADQFGVSQSDFEEVMANVQRIRIRTETHSGHDIGSIDNVTVGTRFSSEFNSGLDGWNAHGDGTMQWTETGGVSNSGYIAVHDWARGDWHYAVAPAAWSGDWSGLINSTFSFYYKSDYPDASAELEISSVFEKRIILTANPLVTPPNSNSRVRVSLNEIPASDVEISLSSENPCFEVPANITINAGASYAEFDATVPADADTGCTSAIEATASGYVSARLILTVGETAGGEGGASLCGQVTDATTGDGIAGAQITVAGLSTTTDNDGNYCIQNIPTNVILANFSGTPRSGPAPLTVQFENLSGVGVSTISASAETYSTFRSTVSLSEGEEKTLDISLSPMITDAEMRIVLNWGLNPRDLDIHLLVPKPGEDTHHLVYYSDKGSSDSFPYAYLDHDDTESYGPETITIKQFVSGRYKFYVHRYAGTGSLTASEAVVQIYTRAGLVHTVNVPASGTGDYWMVGEIDGNTGQVLIDSYIQGLRPSTGALHKGMAAALDQKQVQAAQDIVSWSWDFDGDGVVDSEEQHPQWVYANPGNYTVTLTVSDGTRDYVETKTHYITVTGEPSREDAYKVSITSIDPTNFPLVKLFVSVIDTLTNAPLTGLPFSAFDVTEDNQAVSDLSISTLSMTSGAKADIVFVFDITGSLDDEWNALKNRSLAFADSIAARGMDYRLGLVTFKDEITSIHDFTTDALEFKTWVDGLDPSGGGDSKENALKGLEAAAELSYRAVAQRIAVLITDADYHEAGESGDGITHFTTETMISHLNARNILCNVVGPDEPQFEKLAEQTGGYFYKLSQGFNNILDRIGNQILQQYVITYVPTNTTPDNTQRTAKVQVNYNSKTGSDQGTYYIGSSQLLTFPQVVLGIEGRTFTIDVYAQNVMNLSAAQYYLLYNKNKISALQVTSGGFMSSGGASEAFLSDIDEANGRIEINQSRLIQGNSTESISGSGLLASVEFEVKVRNCASTIDFYGLDLRQTDGTAIEVNSSGTEIESAGSSGSSSILCDFDEDLDIDTRDFALLGTYWKPVNHASGDVGPASGAVPMLTPAPDGRVGFEDLFTFTRMWNWYYLALNTNGSSLAKQDGRLFGQWSENDGKLRYDVYLKNVNRLAMGHLKLSFNTAALTVDRIESGSLLTPSDESCVLFTDTGQPGQVDVTFSKLTGTNQSAVINPSGVLFSILFQRTGQGGASALCFEQVDLRSPDNTPVSVIRDNQDNLEIETLPETYKLANYPNPFNNRTVIRYELPIAGRVDIQIYNILGQPVRELVHNPMQAGIHTVSWDGKNNYGIDAGSGMYMLKMTAGNQSLQRKLLYLK
ncbi:MAG: PKD domain-containing protein [candidate division KSB1 bacterium]|nr:PKD domain-containing protein [candidate division KSB1 bacterium]